MTTTPPSNAVGVDRADLIAALLRYAVGDLRRAAAVGRKALLRSHIEVAA